MTMFRAAAPGVLTLAVSSVECRATTHNDSSPEQRRDPAEFPDAEWTRVDRMDPEKLDELIARLANGATRRDAVKGLVGGALTSVALSSVVSAKGKHGKNAGKGRSSKNKDKGQNKSNGKGKGKGKDTTRGKGKDTNRNDGTTDASTETQAQDSAASDNSQAQGSAASDNIQGRSSDVGAERQASSKSKSKSKGKNTSTNQKRCKKNGKNCGRVQALQYEATN
jgi:hypothetical protein